MTKRDVLECFNMAVKEVLEVEKELISISPESRLSSPDAIIMNLANVLMQAHQIEEQRAPSIVPATASVPNLRTIN